MLVITPSCRPERLPWILDNWRRQNREPGDRQLIVWNGCIPVPCDEPGVTTTFSGERGSIGSAMDAGITFAKAHGFNQWMCMDDDDWYGPRAIERAKRALEEADIAGRISKFYKTVSGEIWLLDMLEREDMPEGYGLATIAARTDAPLFEDGGPSWGVETRWLRIALGLGARTQLIPPQDFVHCRWPNLKHTTELTDACVAFAFDTCVRFVGSDLTLATLDDDQLPQSFEVDFDLNQLMDDLQQASLARSLR